jgi:hypothetical protein
LHTFVAAPRRFSIVGLLLLALFTTVGRRAARNGPPVGFQSMPRLWGGFAVASFIVYAALPWGRNLGGGSYYQQWHRFLDGDVPSASFGDLLFRGGMLAVIAAIFGWVLHAVFIVAVGLLTGGPSFRGR